MPPPRTIKAFLRTFLSIGLIISHATLAQDVPQPISTIAVGSKKVLNSHPKVMVEGAR
jgi:hypothetical protein